MLSDGVGGWVNRRRQMHSPIRESEQKNYANDQETFAGNGSQDQSGPGSASGAAAPGSPQGNVLYNRFNAASIDTGNNTKIADINNNNFTENNNNNNNNNNFGISPREEWRLRKRAMKMGLVGTRKITGEHFHDEKTEQKKQGLRVTNTNFMYDYLHHPIRDSVSVHLSTGKGNNKDGILLLVLAQNIIKRV
jgi:hypothetical protein